MTQAARATGATADDSWHRRQPVASPMREGINAGDPHLGFCDPATQNLHLFGVRLQGDTPLTASPHQGHAAACPTGRDSVGNHLRPEWRQCDIAVQRVHGACAMTPFALQQGYLLLSNPEPLLVPARTRCTQQGKRRGAQGSIRVATKRRQAGTPNPASDYVP